jgi:2-keto-4-pentenoate hydratase
MSDQAEAVRLIAEHRRRHAPLPPLPDRAAPATVEDAYRLQDRVHAALEPDLGPRIGWKIGCTTKVMQDYLKIPSPCAGGLFAGTTHEGTARLSPTAFVRVGIECEIAVRLRRDLMGDVDQETAADAIDSYRAAIELVDDRYVDWSTIGTPTLVADDFFAAGSVLGPLVAARDMPHPEALIGRTIVNGSVVGEGRGSDILGHPHAALAWLAGSLAARGRRLSAGETVLLGSLVRTVWLPAGAEARIVIDGLGEASLVLAEA